MSQAHNFDFAKYVPGFDFLKNLTPGAAPQASAATSPGWVAPTLDPEELEKRIQELKTVQFWLEQNAKAVGATIQALEVQRMTLATLKGMNMSFQDLADSLKVKTPEADAEPKFSFTQAATPKPAAETEVPPKVKPRKPRASKAQAAGAMGVDPAQWWGSLTDQFQHIAHHAMKDMGERANAHMAATAAHAAKTKQTAPKAAVKPAAKTATRKAAPRKTTARKTSKR
jgi:hypothetical protein